MKTDLASDDVLPLPADVTSIQPGGGPCARIEIAWGAVRRAWLRTFRPSYVRRMAELVQPGSDFSRCPHPVLDPRDLKYHRNVTTGGWAAADDPFRWRDRLPFARWGLGELLMLGLPLAACTLAAALLAPGWARLVALVPGLLLAEVVSFFRNPRRVVPAEPDLLVAPADGTIAEIAELEHDEFIGGPAIRIGIFLSIFNVHINRAPCAARTLELRYARGQFLNALNPNSAIVNEAMWIGLESTETPGQRLVVRQIAGQIARRIVCDLRPGEQLERGQAFGMIKLGSRTELILPAAGAEVLVRVKQKVAAGSTAFVRFRRSAE